MNQKNQGSGSSSPSIVPAKRKRGRPRKEESSASHGDNTPIRHGSDNIINSSQAEATTGNAGNAGNEMLGRVVTGVIEGSFGAGYLLNVQVGDTQTYLKGAVFLPGQYEPVTPENDVAPHLKMLERKEFPIPVLNPQAQMQSSTPSSGQGSKQPVEPKSSVLISQDKVLPSEIPSGTSASLENQSASVVLPVAKIPKSSTSIPEGGIPQKLSEPGHVSQPPSIVSEMVCDKLDGGARKDSEATPEAMNLLAMAETEDKELLSGQQAGSSPHKLKEQIQDEPKTELNQMPVSAESESLQSEQVLDQTNDLNSLNQMSVTAEPEPEQMQSEQIHEEPKNSDVILNQIPASSEPEARQSEQIHDEPKNSDIILNQVPASSEHEPMQSEQIHDEPKNSDIILNQMPASSEPKPVQSEQIHDEPKNSDALVNQMPVSSEAEPKQSEQVNDEPKNSDALVNQMPVSSEAEPKQSEQVNDEPKNSDIQLNQMPVSAEAEPETMKSEQIQDEPKNSNIQLNQVPLSAEPEAVQSEHIDELKNSKIELNQMPVSAEPESVQAVDKLLKKEWPKPALETSGTTTLFEGEAARSESKVASEGSNLPGEITKDGDIEPNESVKPVEPEKPIGTDNL